ncbi:CsbD family protein [Algoriphagus namhaensis]
MNSTQAEGNWDVVKGKLKQTYGELTDDDLQKTEGKEDELWGRIQKKVGKTKEAILDEINKL